MKLLYGHSETVAAFVSKLIPNCSRGFGACSAIGVLDDDGALVAGMVYHNWNPESDVIEMSGASLTPRWLTRKVLHAIFYYPFGQLDCQLVVLRVTAGDQRLARIFHAFGMKRYTIPRLRGRTEDEAIYTLTDDDWYSGKFAR